MKWETFPITYPFFSVSIFKSSVWNRRSLVMYDETSVWNDETTMQI